jgi:DNA-directed RNA polymerase specialized sigma24 family protein
MRINDEIAKWMPGLRAEARKVHRQYRLGVTVDADEVLSAGLTKVARILAHHNYRDGDFPFFLGTATFPKWLFFVVRREMKDYAGTVLDHRTGKVQARQVTGVTIADLKSDYGARKGDWLEDARPKPDEEVAATESCEKLKRRVGTAVAALSRKERQVIRKLYLQGRTVADAMKASGIGNRATLRKCEAVALQKLRLTLSPAV